jgi:hypothetical protein
MTAPDTGRPAAPSSPARGDAPPTYHPPGTGVSLGAMAASALLIAAAVAGGIYWWQQQRSRVDVPPVVPPAETAPVAAAPAPPVAAAPPAPVIAHPIEPQSTDAKAAAASQPLAVDPTDTVVVKGVVELLGPRAVATHLRSDDFVRRVVVTLDNLGRAHAAPRLWPTNPMAGKFATERGADGQEVVAAANSARYGAFVGFVESVDVTRAAALYRRHYPLFQAAYKELGYPNAYFNDRAVAVIDQLLATPEPAAPLAVKLVEVKGEVPSTQPWTRWEFADPQLEALSGGQKMLLRMGPDNARRLKAKLRALRSAIAKG